MRASFAVWTRRVNISAHLSPALAADGRGRCARATYECFGVGEGPFVFDKVGKLAALLPNNNRSMAPASELMCLQQGPFLRKVG